jgi:hypothetical protein
VTSFQGNALTVWELGLATCKDAINLKAARSSQPNQKGLAGWGEINKKRRALRNTWNHGKRARDSFPEPSVRDALGF